MDEMLTTIIAALVGGLVGGGSVAKVALMALETRLRTVFATTTDVDGIGRKVERNTGLYVALDDRTGDLEEKVSVLEERQAQQWARIGEQMSQTAAMALDTMKEVKNVAGMMQALALKLERLDAQHPRKGE